nr:unnamed protein product [Callosobruchus chinensis]
MNRRAGGKISSRAPKEESPVIKKETNEHSDEHSISLSRMKTEPNEDHWGDNDANNKEALLKVANTSAINTENGEFEATVDIEQLFIKNENDQNTKAMDILSSIKSEPSDIEWDNCEADKINVLQMRLEHNGSEMDMDSKVNTSEADSSRIKNEYSGSDNLEVGAVSGNFEYQLIEVKSETDMDSKDFQVAEITEECSVKSESESSMNATPDIASTSMAKSKFPRKHHQVESKKAGRKSFTCYNCNRIVYSKQDLIIHMKVHDKNFSCKATVYDDSHNNSYTAKSYSESCVHCNAKYQQRISLDDHIIKKHPEFITSVTRNVYKCTKCTFKTAKKGHFDRHTLMHSGIPSSRKLFTCIHCDVTVKGKMVLTEHVLKKHPDFASSITEKINTCTICNFKTTMKHHFDRHMSVHSGIPSSSKTFMCMYCDAVLKRRNALTDHVVRKHPSFIESVTSKIYECEHCVFKTIKKHDFDKHLSTHFEISPSSSSVTCIHCNDTFKSDRWRDAHIMKRHPEFTSSLTRKVYECTICPYKTILKFKFDRHMLEHPETASSYKFSSCHHCGAKFKIKADLDEHLVENHPNFIVSLSRKVYECTYCVYKTTVKKSLDKHMSSHPEADPSDKPNTCMYCNVTLCNKRVRDDHVVKKHPHLAASVNRKIFECAECSYRTILRSSFSCHMQTHSKSSTNNKSGR